MDVLLITGGWSSERDVALAGGKAIRKALKSLGHTVTEYDPAMSLEGLVEAAEDKDFAFISLHGSPGEDGLIQSLLERVGCPYQGANPASSILALNKSAAKVLYAGAGLNVAPGILLTERPEKEWQPILKYPLFIKANNGGSSLHMEKVDRPGDLSAALDRLFAAGDSFLMESAVSGIEVTCGVLGSLDEHGEETAAALPTILIKPAEGEVFDYTSKYTPGGAEEICPAPIDAKINERIQEMALAAHNALGISGYSRADFIVPENGEPVILEVNTLPGMTSTSLIPQEAAAIGLSFEALIQRLIDLGLARRQRETC